jgi:hypothetical protein
MVTFTITFQGDPPADLKVADKLRIQRHRHRPSLRQPARGDTHMTGFPDATPRPWKSDGLGAVWGGDRWLLTDADEADAALIVAAVNAYDDLEAVVQAARRCLPYVEPDAFSGPNVEAHSARDALVEALARLDAHD